MLSARISTQRRAAHAALALFVPGAVLLLTVAQALTAGPSHASQAQAAMQAVTIHAASPQVPKTLTTGLVVLTLVNDTKQEYSAGFGRLMPGVTASQVRHIDAEQNLDAIGQLFKAVTVLGGVDDIPPGTSQTAIVPFTSPGNYAVSVSPDQGADHLLFFTVTAGTSPATLPAGTVSVTLKSFKFTGLPTKLAAGTTTFQVTNNSTMVHEMALMRLTGGKTQRDLLAFFQAQNANPGAPPAWIHDAGGMGIIAPQQRAAVRVALTPGYYVVVCTMPDLSKQGEPHVMEGMIGHFTVS